MFNRYVTQGIIQGKNVTEIATQAVNGMADTEMHWAENNAITALTSAQNAGTLQQLKEAKAMGLDVKKQWNATLDYHTRETHRLLDQQTAELEEPFKVLGYQIDYPADPHAAPEMVYRCRCRLTGVFGKYNPRNAKRRDNVNKQVVQEQSYQEWYSSKAFKSVSLQEVPVTKEAIERISVFECSTLNWDNQKLLQSAHRNLLRFGSKQELGVEVGRVYSIDMTPITENIVGASREIAAPDPNTPYIMMHTHPDCNILSPADLRKFVDCEHLQMLTAVGHDGKIYAVEKADDYDANAVRNTVQNLLSSSKYFEKQYRADELSDAEVIESLDYIVRKAIADMQRYGVNFYEQ